MIGHHDSGSPMIDSGNRIIGAQDSFHPHRNFTSKITKPLQVAPPDGGIQKRIEYALMHRDSVIGHLSPVVTAVVVARAQRRRVHGEHQ